MRGYKNFESNPRPGDLRHMVEIGYTENIINENGYPEPKDITVCRVWAAVIDAGNQHYRSADVVNTEAVLNFTIRYRTDVKPGMWVKFQDENIRSFSGKKFCSGFSDTSAAAGDGGTLHCEHSFQRTADADEEGADTADFA